MSSVGVTMCEWWYSVWGGEMYTSGCFCRDATCTYFSDVCTVFLLIMSSRTRDTVKLTVCVFRRGVVVEAYWFGWNRAR